MPKQKRPVQRKVKDTPRRIPDADWFRARMHECGQDREGMARALDVVGNSVWLMLSGKRGVRPDEIAIWARLLDAPYMEIVRRFGYDVADNTIAVTGTLHAHGRITVRTPDQVYKVPAPPDLGTTARAVVVESTHSALALFKGAHLYYEPTATVAVDAFDRLSVVELADHGQAPIVGVLTRGELRHVRVIVFGGLETIESQQLVGAWPIRWQRMG